MESEAHGRGAKRAVSEDTGAVALQQAQHMAGKVDWVVLVATMALVQLALVTWSIEEFPGGSGELTDPEAPELQESQVAQRLPFQRSLGTRSTRAWWRRSTQSRSSK